MKRILFTLTALFFLYNANAQNVYDKDPYKSQSARLNYFLPTQNPKILITDADGNLITELAGINDKLNGGLAYYNRAPLAKKMYYQLEGRFNILSAKFNTDSNEENYEETFNNIFDVELGIVGGKYIVSNMLSLQVGANVVMKSFDKDLDLDDHGDFRKKNSMWFAGGPVAGAEFKINNLILLSARYNHYFNNKVKYINGEGAAQKTAEVQLSPGYLEFGLGLSF